MNSSNSIIMIIYSGDIGTRAGSGKTFRTRICDLLNTVLVNKRVYMLCKLLIIFRIVHNDMMLLIFSYSGKRRSNGCIMDCSRG